MAVIICTMLYGAGVNVNQFAETNMFTDVPAWAQGYVNLCSSLGIVAGVGDGKFDPNATVTTAQAVLMLCRALGYFQSAADFGNDWMLAATAKGTALGLYGDLKLTANAGLTRDNVAELVFNALTKGRACSVQRAAGCVLQRELGHHLLPGVQLPADPWATRTSTWSIRPPRTPIWPSRHLGASAPIGWTATPPARAQQGRRSE